MACSSCALVLLVCGGLVLGACKKKDSDPSDSTAVTDTAAPNAAPSAPSTAAAAPPSASAAPTDSASAAPAPAAPTAAVPQRPIDDCCAALAAARRFGRGRAAKNKATRAVEICPGLAALVRQGRATRQQALTQIKSELLGADLPGSCM
jgi:hypothetical protein